jgi:repressor LexA
LTASIWRGLVVVNMRSPLSNEPTKRQRAVLRVIETWQVAGKGTPSFREIGAELGLGNVSAVAKHVAALRRKGCLSKGDGRNRSLQVLSPLRSLQSRLAHIPLFGTIPAGFAEDREQQPDSCVTVDIETIGFKPTRNTFALRVVGDSMIGKHICEGDIAVFEHGPEPRPGQIVAALIDRKNTLKTFLVKNGKPFLKAENPKYPDLIPSEELVIQGVLRALIRRLKE